MKNVFKQLSNNKKFTYFLEDNCSIKNDNSEKNKDDSNWLKIYSDDKSLLN